MKSRNIGLVSALLGSVCCVGPALLMVIIGGSAAFGAAIRAAEIGACSATFDF